MTYFWQQLTAICTKHKTKPTIVVKTIGIARGSVTKWKNGAIPYDSTIQQLADYFNVPLSYFKEEPQTTWINVLGRVAAGIPFEAIEDIIDQEQLSPGTDLSFEYFGLKIQGDSMEPKISNGDTVIVRVQPDCENDDIVIALIDNEEAVCKKIKKTPEGIFLISTNTAYDPLFFTNAEIEQRPITILGKVIELRAKF